MDDVARMEGTERSAASVFADERGKLTLVPLDQIPFAPGRAFVLSELSLGIARAGHACRTQHRFLVGISGQATVTVDDGFRSEREPLASGDTMHIPPATWIEITPNCEGVTILVFADGEYDPSDYMTDRYELPLAASTASVTANPSASVSQASNGKLTTRAARASARANSPARGKARSAGGIG